MSERLKGELQSGPVRGSSDFLPRDRLLAPCSHSLTGERAGHPAPRRHALPTEVRQDRADALPRVRHSHDHAVHGTDACPGLVGPHQPLACQPVHDRHEPGRIGAGAAATTPAALVDLDALPLHALLGQCPNATMLQPRAQHGSGSTPPGRAPQATPQAKTSPEAIRRTAEALVVATPGSR